MAATMQLGAINKDGLAHIFISIQDRKSNIMLQNTLEKTVEIDSENDIIITDKTGNSTTYSLNEKEDGKETHYNDKVQKRFILKNLVSVRFFEQEKCAWKNVAVPCEK